MVLLLDQIGFVAADIVPATLGEETVTAALTQVVWLQSPSPVTF